MCRVNYYILTGVSTCGIRETLFGDYCRKVVEQELEDQMQSGGSDYKRLIVETEIQEAVNV